MKDLLKKFEKSLNQLEFALFAACVAQQFDDVGGSISYLQTVMTTVSSNDQATVVVKANLARFKLANNKIEEAKVLLEEVKSSIESYMGIMESVCHSQFYFAQLEFYKAKGSSAEYFKNSLLYLDYTPITSISQPQQLTLAYDLALAALIGDTIYNFGELLQHPILKVLQGTKHEWLAQTLFVFNAGDIDKWKQIYQSQQASQPALSKNTEFLHQKIRIMGLMEMCFKRTSMSSSRTISFKDISTACVLPTELVEVLLMKAFSLKVVRGQIDQVDQTVRIKWLQPRVLDIQQISGIRDRLKTWSTEVHKTANYLEENFAVASS